MNIWPILIVAGISAATSSLNPFFISGTGYFLQHLEKSKEISPLNWRNRSTLSWSDFQGTPVASAPNAALTSTAILIHFRYSEESLEYQLNCVFYPEKSWTKVRNAHILAHEQGHFDISQLFTRKLHQALQQYKFQSASVSKDVKAIYQQITQEQSAYQVQYDTETNYSRNPIFQEKWLTKIKEELQSLEAYADYPQR